MTVKQPPPSPMEDDESRLEERPSAAKREVRRQIGNLDEDDPVTLSAPSPIRRGQKEVVPGAVGLRSATKRREASERVAAARHESRQKVRAARDEHRQRVWDKLDEARRRADAKRPRINGFRPGRDTEDE